MHHAAENGHLEVVKLLLGAKAHLEVVKWLVPEAGAKVSSKDKNGKIALDLAGINRWWDKATVAGDGGAMGRKGD